MKFPKASELISDRKRILITGGAGFIGSTLVRRLLIESNAIIFNLDKMSYCSDLTSTNNILETICKSHKRYYLIKSDISDLSKVEEAFKIADPDLIFHLAAESHVDRSIDNPSTFLKSNIIGTYNLLQVALRHYREITDKRKKLFRFLQISTDEVFGSLGQKGSFTEKSRYEPNSPYSASKAASDHLANAWHKTYGLPVLVTNCSNNYGPWQFPEKLIPVVILKAIAGKPIPIYGNGKNIRDWLHVEDHIDALLLTLAKGEIGKTYCIGGSNERTNLEVVTSICNTMDEKLRNNFSYSELINMVQDRPGHDLRYSIDASLIRSELAWFPRNEFHNGLSSTIDWYLDNLEWCKNVLTNASYNSQRLGLMNSYSSN